MLDNIVVQNKKQIIINNAKIAISLDILVDTATYAIDDSNINSTTKDHNSNHGSHSSCSHYKKLTKLPIRTKFLIWNLVL